MNTKDAVGRWGLKETEIRKMCQYIEGAHQRRKHGAWEIPDQAKPIYIPDKRKYKYQKKYKGYIYIMDAITGKMNIILHLLNMSEDEYHTIVRELINNNMIVLLEGRGESLSHIDYIPAMQYQNWNEQASFQKVRLISEAIAPVVEAVVKGAVSAMADRIIPSANAESL